MFIETCPVCQAQYSGSTENSAKTSLRRHIREKHPNHTNETNNMALVPQNNTNMTIVQVQNQQLDMANLRIADLEHQLRELKRLNILILGKLGLFEDWEIKDPNLIKVDNFYTKIRENETIRQNQRLFLNKARRFALSNLSNILKSEYLSNVAIQDAFDPILAILEDCLNAIKTTGLRDKNNKVYLRYYEDGSETDEYELLDETYFYIRKIMNIMYESINSVYDKSKDRFIRTFNFNYKRDIEQYEKTRIKYGIKWILDNF